MRFHYLHSFRLFRSPAFGLLLLLLALGAVCATSMLPPAAAQASPQSTPQRTPQTSPDGIWTDLARQAPIASGGGRPSSPEAARAAGLHREALVEALARAPRETPGAAINSDAVLSLPLPGGGFIRFRIEESSVFEPELEARHPEIRSYRGRGIDSPSWTMRADSTPHGFHAIATSGAETIFVHRAGPHRPDQGDPAVRDNPDQDEYVVYAADQAAETDDFVCHSEEPRERSGDAARRAPEGAMRLLAEAQQAGVVRRTYRIAIATTQEYTNSIGGGSVSGTLASLNTWLNQFNLLFERDLAIRLVLVANNANVIYTSESDPFTNGSPGTMLNQVRGVLESQIGIGNYDLGHVLGTLSSGGAGVAYIQVACENFGSPALKGGGASLISANSTVGGSGPTQLIAHEIGHQFGAFHTFNDTSVPCGANRSPASAWESGSGLTLMSYSGNCSPNAITFSGSLHFHAGSIAEILDYIGSTGGSCPTTTMTGNTAPTVNAGPDYTIPRQTPFLLTAAAADPDPGDQAALTYSWEQIDAGGASFGSPPYSDAGDPITTTRPIFRPFAPTISPARFFPRLTYILNNANSPPATIGGLQTAENLPQVGRQLNFASVVRDGRGGTTTDTVRLTVAGGAGPFLVTSPNSATTWTTGSTRTVTWSVNGTNLAPVSCASVRIRLSTDGGQTFPFTLAANTPNDGSETVTIPGGIATTTARIQVEAIGNIFFDISDANLSIVPGDACPAVSGISPQIGHTGSSVVLTGFNFTGVTAVRFSGNVAASFTVVSASQLTATVPAGASSGPITVSKTGCSDAQSGAFTVHPSPPVTLAVDDGSFDNAYGFSSGPTAAYAVNRLTPTAWPAMISTVSIYFSSFSNFPTGSPIEILVGSNPDGDGNINNTTFQSVAATVGALDQFTVYAVPTVTIQSGDFVVGFRYTPISGTFPIVFDTTQSRGRSYGSTDGANFIVQDNFGAVYAGNAGIRASVYQGQSSTSCNPAISAGSALLTAAGGSGSVGVTINAGCQWTATSSDGWIQVTSGSGGVGDGTVNFNVPAHTGTARSGTMTIAGLNFTIRQGANFTDVPAGNPFYDVIGKLSASGITGGCGQNPQGQPLYCPGSTVTREQMAVFIIRATGEFNPPPPQQQRFMDVPPSSPFYAFIEQMAVRGITSGCGGGNYCPGSTVTREQMAVFIIRATGDFNPPPPQQQRFMDVPPSNPFYAFIEQMAVRGITSGCSGGNYCPGAVVTREQMAAFMARAFGL